MNKHCSSVSTVSQENRTEIHQLVAYIRNDLEPFIKDLQHKIKCLETDLQEVKKSTRNRKRNRINLDVSSDDESVPEKSTLTKKNKIRQNSRKQKTSKQKQ
jgi:hypothetical protein